MVSKILEESNNENKKTIEWWEKPFNEMTEEECWRYCNQRCDDFELTFDNYRGE